MPRQSASSAKSALFFPHCYWKHLSHRIKVTMATCSCKINPRRWQQFSALRSISTSKHILHAPYNLFKHPSNLAFLEYYIFILFLGMYVMRECTGHGCGGQRPTCRSLLLHCVGSRDHTYVGKLAQQAFLPTEPSCSNAWHALFLSMLASSMYVLPPTIFHFSLLIAMET